LEKVIVNCETGEQITVAMTAEEIAEMQKLADAELAAQEAASLEAERIMALKSSAKEKLVAGQPLTEDEAAVLVF
jgi:hypothetical protein